MLGVLRAAIPGAAFAQTWPNLVNLWTFDETSAAGGVFADSGPANVPMTIVGTWADLSTGSLVQDTPGTSAYTNGSGHATIPASQPAHNLSELTISFYYQRNSAAAKHILLAAGDGTQVGDFSIEVLPNGRLRGYHVGDDAQLRLFASRNGIAGTNVHVGTAHRIDLTLGPLGATIYLDGSPLVDAFIPANRNGWNNTRVKHLGTWIDGVTDGADGAFDGFRLWDRQLTAAQIASLEPAQSITLPQSATVNVGALEAFTHSTVNVTTLEGWPVGRLPKRILQQGTHASAYVRRSWKPSLNNGTHIDFVPGWQKTTAEEVIRLRLDDDSEIDLTYTVGHTTPSPTGSGVTRTLDPSATPSGTTYTTWSSAVAALTSGDVLVVRAPTGTWTDSGEHPIPNYVYDVGVNAAPADGVSNVTIIAHPDDVAAGRRPVIWRNAGRYARFKYDAANSWQVHADLGSGRVIYQSVETSTQPSHSYFAAYRDQVGDWIGLYGYQAINDSTDRSSIMHDTSYPRFSGTNNNTYVGPSLIYNKTTSRFEVRLDGPVKQVYMNPGSSAPFPPWDWSKNQPPSVDARQCEIVITDGDSQSSRNYLLDIAGRNGWKFYNLDFVYGNSVLNAESLTTQPEFYGCTFLGGAHPEFDHGGSEISFDSSAIYNLNAGSHNNDMLFDRCTLHGCSPPWTSWQEGKGFDGVHGHIVRREISSWSNERQVYRFSKLANWWHLFWMGDFRTPKRPIKCHFHHCLLRYFGFDGALLQQDSGGSYMVNRCFLPNTQIYGFTIKGGAGVLRHHSFNVEVRLTTGHLGHGAVGATASNKWSDAGTSTDVACYVFAQSLAHGGRSEHSDRRYHNTCVGSQNGVTHEAWDSSEHCGSGIGPDTRGTNNRVFNSIGAVYPAPFAWPLGRSALVALYTREGGNNQYDNNVLFKSSGMLAPGNGSHTFIKVNSGSGAGTAYASLNALQLGEGFDLNSTQADPQFVVSPAWASSDPHAAGGAWDMASYMLGPSSPARTGARNLDDQSVPDYDFETPTTLAAGTNLPFRGALDPRISFIEQEVGIVGPLPPEIN